MKIGLQTNVWSPERHQDLPQMLGEIAAAGYNGFEIGAHRIDLTQPARFRALADNCGLAVAGLHNHGELHNAEAMRAVFEKLKQAAQFAREVGAACVLLSGRPKDGKTDDELRASAQALNQAGEIAREAGLPLYYHNHYWELADQMRELECLAGQTDPELVSLALDVGWVQRAGYDPTAVIARFAPRIRYLHLKDTRDDQWIELGQGTVDFAQVLAAVREHLGDCWLTVERDEVLPDALESATTSREYLRTLGL